MEVGVPADRPRRGGAGSAACRLVQQVAEDVEQEEDGHDVQVREEALRLKNENVSHENSRRASEIDVCIVSRR